ncbi:MAG: helix-turn-helix transcriptional regulator [Calothrix sp. FI2-JRJ7]|jgi:transcriptional regulator with XRE-family HTH domain|nr:helix-turn-helix transcriptional regulator [Calothrix sp. FI2-JRJ7]
MNFSQALDRTLEKYGISAKWLSEQTGVSQQMISGFRRGQQRIYSDSLERLLAGLPSEAKNYLLCQLGEVDTGKIDIRSLVLSASPTEKAEILNTLANWVLLSKEDIAQNAELVKIR